MAWSFEGSCRAISFWKNFFWVWQQLLRKSSVWMSSSSESLTKFEIMETENLGVIGQRAYVWKMDWAFGRSLYSPERNSNKSGRSSLDWKDQ